MNLSEVKALVESFTAKNLNENYKIVEITKKDDEWIVSVEITEESDYFRRLGKMDVIGLYQIDINQTGEVYGYKRVLLRERTDLDWNGSN